ncbi:MAG: hypothetical protein KIT84_10850 [Labilithrix sp.]|nr:hypothetical protein [Labilithrix sp.]MCW5811505.1 hypothetical protein [Labilithrix sp.]
MTKRHGLPRAVVAALLLVAPARASSADGADTDHDGTPDATEIELGLDPKVVTIPEPLLFDMVRGLGARRGELEVNALVQTVSRGEHLVTGGPELEYVFANGYGVELELPASSKGIDAWKASVQGTLPAIADGMITHGWLATGEYLLGPPGVRATGLYIAAARFDTRWSVLTMIGARVSGRRRGGSGHAGVVNPSVFYDLSGHLTIGVEANSILEGDGTRDLVLLPQIHWQPTRELKLQLGSGAQVDEAGATFLSALRISFMY